MEFYVKVARREGKLKPGHQRHMAQAVRGELQITEQWVADWNRHTLVATLRATSADVLPPLYDVHIHFAQNLLMTLSGIERIPDGFAGGGTFDHPQSWLMSLAIDVDVKDLAFQLEEAKRLREKLHHEAFPRTCSAHPPPRDEAETDRLRARYGNERTP
jgi:hypothetical protein